MLKQNKRQLNFSAIILIVLFLAVVAGEARASTYYVSPTGNDIYNGSISTPFNTIQKAANTVKAGDAVYVRAGTYNERVVLTRSGTPGNYITFQNYPGETVTLDGTGLGDGIMFHGRGLSYVILKGFKIGNFTGAGILFQPNVSNGFSGSHIEIRDNEIYNMSVGPSTGNPIKIVTWPWGSTNTYSDIIVDGNYIHNVLTGSSKLGGANEALTISGDINRFQVTNNIIAKTNRIAIDAVGKGWQYPLNGIISGNTIRNSGTQRHDTGIYIDGAQYITIENNVVHDNAGNGIYAGNENAGGYAGMPDPVTTDGIIIRRNRVWNNYRNIAIGGGSKGTSQNTRVVHNTAVTTTTGKQSNYFLGKGTGHIGKNNIGYWSTTGSFFMLEKQWNATTNPTLDYNKYYPASGVKYRYGDNHSHTSFLAYNIAKKQDLNSITSDPKFSNLGTLDLTLQSGSPAIDAGDFLARTTASGSGTVIPVGDARYFHDGYGISGVSGDTIRVGSNMVTVIDVNYSTNTITVNRRISWNSGDGVSYSYSGSKPDIGAYEYEGSGINSSTTTSPKDTTPPSTPHMK
jgi:parallel beta-helix repeat protein